MDDRLGWHFTNNGKYTVQSGYQVERVYPDKEKPPDFYGPTVDVLKAYCWKLKCPPKIRHFLWQLLSGCIAVMKNLNARGIHGDIFCSRCGDQEESINHVFFYCHPARQVWALSKILGLLGLLCVIGILRLLDLLCVIRTSRTTGFIMCNSDYYDYLVILCII